MRLPLQNRQIQAIHRSAYVRRHLHQDQRPWAVALRYKPLTTWTAGRGGCGIEQEVQALDIHDAFDGPQTCPQRLRDHVATSQDVVSIHVLIPVRAMIEHEWPEKF